MQDTLTTRLKKRWEKLIPPTRSCKICFKTISENSLPSILNKKIIICQNCLEELKPKFISFRAGDYPAIAVYEYNEFVKKLIYQFKGCFDYELFSVFLNLYHKEIQLRYKDYIVIPVPSYKPDDEIRGFNHVIEAFKLLDLKVIDIIEKTAHFKQANNTGKKRREIKKYLRLKEEIDLTNKKVLIVDDIYTTGATMNAAIKLVEKLNPKKIRVFVLAKTKERKDYK